MRKQVKREVTLGIVLKDTFGKEYSLEKPLSIGSDPSNTLILLDSSVSPFHSEISLSKGEIIVIDKDSDDGVYVNGKQITGSRVVNIGDTVAIGKVVFKVTGPEYEPTLEEIQKKIGLDLSHDDNLIFAIEPELPESPDLTEPDIVLTLDPPVTEDAIYSVQSPGYIDVEEPSFEADSMSAVIPDARLDSVIPVDNKKEPSKNTAGAFVVDVIRSAMRNPKLLTAIGGFIVLLAIGTGFFIKTIVPLISRQSATSKGGPVMLDLQDEALNTVYSTSFIQHQEDIYEGVDVNGSPLKIKIVQENMEQSIPDWSNYTHFQLTNNRAIEKDTEFSIINGRVYARAKNSCNVFADSNAKEHSPTNWPGSFLRSYITGTAKKTASGIKVNGVLTDRYELKKENSPFADSLISMSDSELFRAQEGGYLVKMVISQTWPADKWQGAATYRFAGDQPVTIKTIIDFTYYPTGKLRVIVPGVCAGKLRPIQ